MSPPAPGFPSTDVVAGRYALCDPLETGGSGTVWRAWDLQRRAYCAAKLLRRREAGQLLRFVREQQVRLTGQHIASPYAWAAEESDVLIATELVDGGSLHRLTTEHGPLAEAMVAAILDQLLIGLQAVHSAGLVHRDVKPGNVLLRATREGPVHVLLIDFGLAIRADDARLTELGMVIGTPGYLPPELANAHTGPAPAQDLFAAGRLAAALLTAREPKLGVPQEVRIADPVLRAVVDALVDPDPDRRPADAATARAVLAGARRDPHPLSAAGRRIDVVPRIPPLPAGWDAVHGPGGGVRANGPGLAARPAGPATRFDLVPEAAAPQDIPVATGPVPMQQGPAHGSQVHGSQAPASRVPWNQEPSSRRAPRRPSRWPLVVGGLGLVLSMTGVVIGVTGSRATEQVDGRSGEGPGSSVSSPGVPGSAAVGPRAGQDCDWSDEGRTSPGPDGAVTCRLADGRYHWSVGG